MFTKFNELHNQKFYHNYIEYPPAEYFGNDIGYNTMPFGPSSSEEVYCSPSSDPFISQQDSEPVVVSPKDIQSIWSSNIEVPTSSFPSFPFRHSSFTFGHEYERIVSKTRSKSVDILPYRSKHEFELSDDEESTSISQQSQFYMELTDDDMSFDEMSIDDDNESVELDYSSYNKDGNLNDEMCECPYGINDIDVTLQVSKTPCLDALVFCLALRFGAYQSKENKLKGEIVVTNATKFLDGIHHFCPKKSQTQNDEARIKALKRWFDGIPAKRRRNQPFIMRIKPNKINDVNRIIKKMSKFVAKSGLLPIKTNNNPNFFQHQ